MANIIKHRFANVERHTGKGVPTHKAKQYTEYTDTQTNLKYINIDGGTDWKIRSIFIYDTVSDVENLDSDVRFVICDETGIIYKYDATSGKTRDGIYVLNTADGGDTRFVSVYDPNGGGTLITVTSSITTGGIETGKTYIGKTPNDMWDIFLNPTLYPTLVDPNSNMSKSPTQTYREIGEVLDVILTTNFNRGVINPQYTALEPYRSGIPNTYTWSGVGVPSSPIPSTNLSDTQTASGYVIVPGTQTWSCIVSYDEGVQPKDSKGDDYNSPLPAGSLPAVNQSIIGVYPIFATTAVIGTLTKQSLQATGSTITTNMVAESGGNKQTIDIPDNWGGITTLQQYNTLSGSWDTIDLSTFTISFVTNVIQGNVVNYTRYTHNGANIGARQLRWL
jgi:hypothetical protein